MIVKSLIDRNVFFIFRDDGAEVKCVIDKQNIIRPEFYKITIDERVLINTIYSNHAIRLSHKKEG